jgi:hypothetical protein
LKARTQQKGKNANQDPDPGRRARIPTKIQIPAEEQECQPRSRSRQKSKNANQDPDPDRRARMPTKIQIPAIFL